MDHFTDALHARSRNSNHSNCSPTRRRGNCKNRVQCFATHGAYFPPSGRDKGSRELTPTKLGEADISLGALLGKVSLTILSLVRNAIEAVGN